MKQITEDYCSFETAKLLKEKGFNEPCRQAYFNGSLVDYTMYGFCDGELIDCPSQSLALKWLREVHNIIIVIEPHAYNYSDEKTSSYVFGIWKGDNYMDVYFTKIVVFVEFRTLLMRKLLKQRVFGY